MALWDYIEEATYLALSKTEFFEKHKYSMALGQYFMDWSCYISYLSVLKILYSLESYQSQLKDRYSHWKSKWSQWRS